MEDRDFCIVEVRNDAPFLNQDYNQTLYYWVEKGGCLTVLPDYEEEGYLWKGYRDQQSGEIVTCNTPVTGDCVLEAVWEKTGGA